MSFRDLLHQRRLTRSHLQEYRTIVPVLVLAAAIVLATIFQVWLGYRATQQWRTSASMVVEQRVDEVASLLLISLLRDMRGGFESLAPFRAEQAISSSPQELAEALSRTFARFPYIDCFFLWRTGRNGTDSAVVFTRTDRAPVWDKTAQVDYSFPVKIIPSNTVAFKLASLARQYALRKDQFAFFDATVEGAAYQVVTRRFPGGDSVQETQHPSAILGFAVDLQWVKTKYFFEFTHEMERLLGSQGATALSLSIVDDRTRLITQTIPEKSNSLSREKKFPLLFFDSSSTSANALEHVDLRRWTARVAAVDDPLLGTANAGAEQTGIFIFSAAFISVAALIVVIRFLRMNIELFAMKADFVAMVSHELKTPLASISLVGQAMEKGRWKPVQIQDYGSLLSKETARLIRLVENLLTISRITDSKPLYSMSPADARELLNEAISRLHTHIQAKGVTIRCENSEDLPKVSCDSGAITQVFENIIDNAIKYSDNFSEIEVSMSRFNNGVSIVVKDNGHGIPQKDLPLIFNRFFRGKNAGLNGSGIGLSIAKKVIQDHGGNISVESVLNQGTVVHITLPSGAE